jgi:hypothetical protein
MVFLYHATNHQKGRLSHCPRHDLRAPRAGFGAEVNTTSEGADVRIAANL